MVPLDQLGAEIKKKRPHMQKMEKVLFRQDNTWIKLDELNFILLFHPPYSLELAPRDNWLFKNMRKMLQVKKFGWNEEVIVETEAYFETVLHKGQRKVRGTLELSKEFMNKVEFDRRLIELIKSVFMFSSINIFILFK